MFKKLILFILIFFILYILSIFKVPQLAGFIEKSLGFNGFNEFVLSFKGNVDNTVTKVPSSEEFLSGAIDIKNIVIDGVSKTQNGIDSFRQTMSGAEKTYNNVKNGYNQAKEGYEEVRDFINTNSGKIEEVKEVINTIKDISETLTNTGTTN